MSEERKKGPLKTGDTEVDITALIIYVAPQLTGERPYEEDTQANIDAIIRLQREGKLNGNHKKMLMGIQFHRIDDGSF